MNARILDDLTARGLIHDSTDQAQLTQALSDPGATLYCGFDPTADSLHTGNLVGLLALRRFKEAGHPPIALAGGATGMVGDPSGRSDERNLLDDETLAHNLASIKEQMRQVVGNIELVDNSTWTRDVTLLEFLRDVGKHFTVNQMVAKDSVRSRMEGEAGISYTEFSYMLLQAFDFWWLNANKNCVLQIGGSDQWGNIVAGIDLIRRRTGRAAHGLTFPLLTRADGTKFGKSMGENIWLSPMRTSPYKFYQYFINTDDRDLERFLLQLTLLPVDEVRAIADAHAADPGKREGQRALARAVTDIVHGAAAREAAEQATAVVFGGEPTAAALNSLIDEVPTTRLGAGESLTVTDLLLRAQICASKGEARRLLDQGGATVNGVKLPGDHVLTLADLVFERFHLLRKGKRSVFLVVVE